MVILCMTQYLLNIVSFQSHNSIPLSFTSIHFLYYLPQPFPSTSLACIIVYLFTLPLSPSLLPVLAKDNDDKPDFVAKAKYLTAASDRREQPLKSTSVRVFRRGERLNVYKGKGIKGNRGLKGGNG